MIYFVTALAFTAYLTIVFLIGAMLKLSGAQVWIFRLLLAFIGLIAAGVCLYFLHRKNKSKDGAPALANEGPSDDLEFSLHEAEAKLTASRLGSGARYSKLPAVFLIGHPGSAKTTAVIQSGLNPELLTGQAFQDDLVIPTQLLNLWYGGGAIFVDAGAKLLSDASSWTRLVRRMQPGKLQSMVGSSEQSPRAAVVCLDCEIFVKGGATEHLAVLARQLRERLTDISNTLGISVPVYVLFTKLDKISFFHDYVHNFTSEEAGQVFGTTLPIGSSKTAAVFGEEASRKFTEAFNKLFFSLCDKRPEFLSRENDPALLPGVYEFPREFRKLRQLLVQFLVDLCRPNPLKVGPFLRGFYFCGVRPIVVGDNAPAAVPARASKETYAPESGATRMFRMEDVLPGPMTAAFSAQAGSVRKVPQWVFLNHFFGDVLLADRSALGESASSTKVNLLRRVLFASAAALCVLLITVFIVSFVNNRRLEQTVLTAARGTSSLTSATLVPPLDSLQKLETLRQSLETLARYDREGPPWSMRWGLYSGDGLYPEVRSIYFDRFRQLLFGKTQDLLLGTLKALPNAPGRNDNPTYAYDTLKAYLITTSNHEKSTLQFLAPLLGTRWAVGRSVDPARMQLAQKQFDFYSQELRIANPYSSENDADAVKHARRYLLQLAAAEPVYQAMLTEANKKFEPVNFNKKFPGAAEVVVDSKDVSGAFTKDGWAFMQDAIKHPDRYFNGEAWVLGDQAAQTMDPAKLQQDLNSRYNSDFIKQWRDYIRQGKVVKYIDIPDAAKKLGRTASGQSPLLAMFCLAAQNTGVDGPDVVKAFKPVHTVATPATCADQPIGPANNDYITKLSDLQISLDELAHQPPGGSDAASAASHEKAKSALASTRLMALTFGHEDPEGTVQKLLEAPITYADGLIGGLGPEELNRKGKGLCADMQRLLFSRYPFNPKSSVPAKLEDVDAVFRPQQGTFWVFYDQNLKKLLPKQGNDYVPDPSITPGFLRFFKNAAAFSNALYQGGAPQPQLSYSLRPILSQEIQSVRLSIDGQTADYSPQSAAAKPFTWPGTGTEIKMSVKEGGNDFIYPSYNGAWSVFEFFWEADASAETVKGGSYEWRLSSGKEHRPVTGANGQPIVIRFELDMGSSPHVFRKGYFSQLGCVAEIAK